MHDFSDICQMKFMEALPLMRIVSGSNLNMHVERRWMEVILHQQGPDGLTYWPTRGRPWALINSGFWVSPNSDSGNIDQYIHPIYCGRLLQALMLYYKRDGGLFWKDVAQRLVDGLVGLAIDRGRYAYFAPSPLWAEKGRTDNYGERMPLIGGHNAYIVFGLVHVYRETGYEPAIKLAQKLIRYILEEVRYFDNEGRFMPDSPPEMWGAQAHFHMHTYCLLSILEYGRVTGDATLVELAKKGYEYGKANGNVLLGYFPEKIGTAELEHSELCEVADMIVLGLKLTDAGAGDYWDDVDRWTRNMFAEGQLTRTDWLNRVHLGRLENAREKDIPDSVVGHNETTERVAERNLGAFAGWPKANDWYVGHGSGIMHCCTGNGTRAIYYLWDHILTHEKGNLRVNLLLNRASPWADVDSHIPYAGQVDVKVKQPVNLSIRIPEWVSPEEVHCRVADGGTRPISWDGRYAHVGSVKPGDVVTLTFPIAESTEVVYVEKEKYTLIRKGNEVVNIDPPGKYCPLYQRDHYRVNTTRWRKIERFVSKEIIHY
jgi:hypothetical protein